MSKARAALLLALAMTGAVQAGAPDQPRSDQSPEGGWFPFPLTLPGTNAPAFDLSRLNEKPAGRSGWLRAEGEGFVDGAGRPVRLLGGNLTARACFPAPEAAPALARGMARYGCNVVRLHFLDNQWDRGPTALSLMTEANDPPGQGLNPAGLARLDAFIAALKAEGILVNLNLHVGRTYPGTPPGLTQNSKGLDQFMPDMIQGLKDYARLLLTHVNPHTGLAYKDDPAIAILEISNEDSLVLNPWWIERLQGEPAAELGRRWIAWLRQRHPDTAALRAAWGVDAGYTGGDLLPAAGLTAWIVEQHGGAKHEVAAAADGVVRWTGRVRGSDSWHMQLGSGRLPLQAGQRYEIKLRARSPTGNTIQFYAAQAGAPWTNLGLSAPCELGAEWRDFQFNLQPAAVSTQSGARLVFSLLNRTGIVDFAAVQCRPVSSGYLKPGQTYESGELPLPRQGAPAVVREDFFRFLADTEVAFATGIRRYLREELGCRALIADSQVLFGGPLGARREFLVSDFVDTHGYWHHPSFPNKPWDRRDWRIVNESQVRSWDGGTLAEMAMLRPVGKPYTISEYDIPAPNDHAAELWPMLAAMAGFQGWDALYHYTWGHSEADLAADHVSEFFNAAGHPAKMGLLPAAAVMFRLGLVAPARRQVVLPVNDQELFTLAAQLNGGMWGAWRELWDRAAKLNGGLALRHRVGLGITGDRAPAALTGEAPAELASPHESDTGEWTWDTTAGLFVLRAPAARAWCGALAGRTLAAADTVLRVGELPTPAPHATVVLVALDGKPIASSGQLLLTALRRAENEGMAFNADRTTVGDQWGHGPARVLGLDATLQLPPGTRWKIETLDAGGAVRRKVADAGTEVVIRPADATIWWLLTRDPAQ